MPKAYHNILSIRGGLISMGGLISIGYYNKNMVSGIENTILSLSRLILAVTCSDKVTLMKSTAMVCKYPYIIYFNKVKRDRIVQMEIEITLWG